MRKFKTLLFPLLTIAALLVMGVFFFLRNRPAAGSVRTQHAAVEVGQPAPLNLNTASAQELEQLPGIGPVLAQRIVADREANGAFRMTEDLMRVSGVGSRIYQQICDLVYVEENHENRNH